MFPGRCEDAGLGGAVAVRRAQRRIWGRRPRRRISAAHQEDGKGDEYSPARANDQAISLA